MRWQLRDDLLALAAIALGGAIATAATVAALLQRPPGPPAVHRIALPADAVLSAYTDVYWRHPRGHDLIVMHEVEILGLEADGDFIIELSRLQREELALHERMAAAEGTELRLRPHVPTNPLMP